MVCAMLIFCSLAQVTQFPSINFSVRIRDSAGVVQFSDSFHQVSDCGFCSDLVHEVPVCGFCSSFHQQHQHIAWEMEVTGLNRTTEPEIALIFQYLYGNSTQTAFSVLCDLISNQQMLVIGCTFTSYEASLIGRIFDDIMTKMLTPGGEPVLPKAKLGTVSSAPYMIQHSSRKVLEAASSVFDMIRYIFRKVSCFRSSISSFVYEKEVLYEYILLGVLNLNESIPGYTSYPGGITIRDRPLSWLSPIFSEQISGFRSSEIIFGTNYTEERRVSCPLDAKDKVLQLGVQVRSNISQFVSTINDENNTTHITGFSVRVFEAAVRLLPCNITYKLIPFSASSDELVEKVYHKTFDVAIGDIVTTARRYQRVEFSLPYLEPGFTMVVKAKNNELNKIWWFLSPFTPKMWVMIAVSNVFIGAVIWIIEGQDEDGPNFLETLFFVHRRPLQSNAARILKVVWVFVTLILTQVYTSMLTTMLINSQREASTLDVDSLKMTNAPIGCDGEYQTIWYLGKVLGFKRRNIKIIASTDKYAEALTSGNIKAAFLLTPYAKAFLAEHCADFVDIKLPTYSNELGGFRFLFPKDSPWASGISEAILALQESGELRQMEEEMSLFSDCPIEDPRPIELSPFRGFFVICGDTAAIALLITLIKLLYRRWEERIQRMLIGMRLWLWLGLPQRTLLGRELLRPRRLHMQRMLMV